MCVCLFFVSKREKRERERAFLLPAWMEEKKEEERTVFPPLYPAGALASFRTQKKMTDPLLTQAVEATYDLCRLYIGS